MNSVSERSFVCLDRSFFSQGYSSLEQPSLPDAPHEGGAAPKTQAKKIVDEDELGFGFDEGEEEVKKAASSLPVL
jgi:hypothetical protein